MVYFISLDVDHIVDVAIPLEGLEKAVAVNWDSRTDRIYWADISLHTISSAFINVSRWCSCT